MIGLAYGLAGLAGTFIGVAMENVMLGMGVYFGLVTLIVAAQLK